MKRISSEVVILTNDKMGHISEYLLTNGNKYLVCFVEERYYGYRKLSSDGFLLDAEKYDDFIGMLKKTYQVITF